MKELKKMTGAINIAAGKVASVADKAVSKGKGMVQTAVLLRKHAKALEALGALVYSLHKRGEENTLLFNRHIQTIERIELKLKAHNANIGYSIKTHECSHCGQKINANVVFCRFCGEKLQ